MIAFVIDASIRGYLIKESKKCDEIIKPLDGNRDGNRDAARGRKQGRS